MKKILTILSGLGLTSMFASNIVACSWKVPPVSVEKLGEIFNSVKNQANTSLHEETNVSRISSGKFQMIMNNTKVEDQTSELSKIWADGLTVLLANDLTKKINEQKNIIDGKETEFSYNGSPISSEYLKLVMSYHFTVRISDVLAVDTGNWLSEQNLSSSSDKIQKTPVQVNGSPVSIDEKNVPLTPNDKEKEYSAIDISGLWALQNENMISKEYIIRYLFSFGPTTALKIDPVLFYVEAVMEN